jgi:hypothetical protein
LQNHHLCLSSGGRVTSETALCRRPVNPTLLPEGLFLKQYVYLQERDLWLSKDVRSGERVEIVFEDETTIDLCRRANRGSTRASNCFFATLEIELGTNRLIALNCRN